MNYPGFVGPSYTLRMKKADAEKCLNWYVELKEQGNPKSEMWLLPTPGLVAFATAVVDPVRAMFHQDGRAFSVIGATLYEVLSNGTLTSRGTVTLDSSPATICSSGGGGHQLFVTSGGDGYILDLDTNVFTTIAGLDVTMGAFLDGFFLALDTVNHTIRISEYYDGLTWDPLQFRVRAVAGDNWVSMTATHGEIWLFGSETYEVWNNTGAVPFPFAPIPNVSYNQGNVAPFSMALFGETVAWLGGNKQGQGTVLMGDQYAPKRISNHAVEFAIQQYLKDGFDIDDAVAFTYQEDGHTFYVLTFVDADATWVYDFVTGMWHERAFWQTAPPVPAHFEAWRPMYHCEAFGKHLVGDREDGVIYEMGLNFPADAGGFEIRRIRRVPYLGPENLQVTMSRLEVDMQTGIGAISGQGEDPMVMFRQSKDGGQTWGNERMKSAGPRGVSKARVYWNQLGSARGGQRVMEISVSDPVQPWCIAGAYLRPPEVADI
jgi:hypothetical protein